MKHMKNYHWEQLRSVIKSYPLFAGNTLSHEAAATCADNGLIVRNAGGDWIPTAKGIIAHNTHEILSEQEKEQ